MSSFAPTTPASAPAPHRDPTPPTGSPITPPPANHAEGAGHNCAELERKYAHATANCQQFHIQLTFAVQRVQALLAEGDALKAAMGDPAQHVLAAEARVQALQAEVQTLQQAVRDLGVQTAAKETAEEELAREKTKSARRKTQRDELKTERDEWRGEAVEWRGKAEAHREEYVCRMKAGVKKARAKARREAAVAGGMVGGRVVRRRKEVVETAAKTRPRRAGARY
ncbi:hypothetical protein MMC13_007439 [Lambiella insularis]|nr:hypothetical protein [Lambiella insularis]